jgi:hypothetical protein
MGKHIKAPQSAKDLRQPFEVRIIFMLYPGGTHLKRKRRQPMKLMKTLTAVTIGIQEGSLEGMSKKEITSWE